MKTRSINLPARYRHGLKQIGSLRPDPEYARAALPTLRLPNTRGTHVEDHSNPGLRAVFPRGAADAGGRHPMVDDALGISATVPRRRSDAPGWGRTHHRRR